MGKQGHGIGKGKPKMRDRHTGMGRALIKQQQQGGGGLNGIEARSNAAAASSKDLHTVLDSSGLDDFVDYIEMEGKEVDVRRVKTDADAAFLIEGTTATTPLQQTLTIDQYEYEHLPVPRKPKWSRSMTAEDVAHNERVAFVKWRRRIAELEDANQGAFRATPFEKNIEVWRQLWRVMERSDMAVQVVDSRNPLLYFTEDLLKYASEHSPAVPMMLVLNKADFLTEYQRIQWARQLDTLGIKYVFYSASREQKKVDALATITAAQAHHDLSEEEEEAIQNAFEECDRVEVRALLDDLVTRFGQDARRATGKSKGKNGNVEDKEENVDEEVEDGVGNVSAIEQMENDYTRSRILTRAELVILLQELPLRLELQPQERHGNRACVGMVGFPNVGKSSCINSIMGVSKSTHGKTRVAVSSTPGKTKHFQTLMINDGLMLCDCPGLVFPSFMRSTGEMLCAGILPINQMRTYLDPASVITSRVPMHLIDATYGINIVKVLDVKDNPMRPPTGSEMLEAYCKVKGYITGSSGRWDEFRACKEIIRDFCDGSLLYVCPPEIVSDSLRWLQETERTVLMNEKTSERLATKRLKEAEALARGDAVPVNVFRSNASTAADGESEFVFGDGAYDQATDDTPEQPDGEEAAVAAAAVADADAEKTVSGQEGSDVVQPQAVAVPAGTVFDDESSDDEEGFEEEAEVAMGADGSKPKRDHKKLKHWGKKNRKLKDKNPYGEENGSVSYQAFTKNRVAAPKAQGRSGAMRTTRAVHKTGGDSNEATTGGGVNFTRQTLPHHPSAVRPGAI
jgi:large subunit GTPase 1